MSFDVQRLLMGSRPSIREQHVFETINYYFNVVLAKVGATKGIVTWTVIVQVNAPVLQIVDKLRMGPQNGLTPVVCSLDFRSIGGRSGEWLSQVEGSDAITVRSGVIGKLLRK